MTNRSRRGYNGKWIRKRIAPRQQGRGTGVKEYRPTASDNLFTAYMDYLRFMDSYSKPTEPQPPTLTGDQKAGLKRAIEAACMEYFKAENDV